MHLPNNATPQEKSIHCHSTVDKILQTGHNNCPEMLNLLCKHFEVANSMINQAKGMLIEYFRSTILRGLKKGSLQ